MQRNYIGPNLMNQVNVSPALLTSLACDLLSLCEGQTETLALQHALVITANQEHSDL